MLGKGQSAFPVFFADDREDVVQVTEMLQRQTAQFVVSF